MTTVNKRVGFPVANVINGIDNGGVVTVAIQEGYENIIRSSPEGLGPPVIDRDCQFCRGVIVTQDWVHIIELLTGTVSTYVFYERKSGVAEATGFVKHTLTNPVIYQVSFNFGQGAFATVSASFECKAADPTKTIADMHAMTDAQPAPTYITASHGGWRIVSATYGGSLSIYHVTGFTFNITLPLVKACNDSDIGYTAVDARTDGLTAAGSINFQDAEIATAKLKCQALLLAAIGSFVVTVAQSGGTTKVITIVRASILNAGENSDVNAPFTGFTAAFEVSNDQTNPLTLTGTYKILTIA
jgi:hypothetical protein